MNLNFRNNEYDLNGSMLDEVIRLYGVPLKLMLATRVNKDFTFGDHSHIKLDKNLVYEMYGLPENPEDFDEYERLETQFGMPIGQTMNIFISKNTALNLIKWSENSKNEIDITLGMIHQLLSSLIILPGGKILEITNFDLDPPGLSNMFAFNKQKNVIRLMCKSYVHDDANEIDVDESVTGEPVENPNTENFESLEKYFDELVDIKVKQDEEAEDFNSYEDDVFGRF